MHLERQSAVAGARINKIRAAKFKEIGDLVGSRTKRDESQDHLRRQRLREGNWLRRARALSQGFDRCFRLRPTGIVALMLEGLYPQDVFFASTVRRSDCGMATVPRCGEDLMSISPGMLIVMIFVRLKTSLRGFFSRISGAPR